MVTKSHDRSAPPLLIWIIVVFVLIVQQSAFIEMPGLGSFSGSDSQDANLLNTISVGLSFVAIAPLLLGNGHKVRDLASKNPLSLLYILLVLMSATWSLHPDLTIRRGAGYVLSMLLAAYLTVRFTDLEKMNLLSASFAISGIGSLLYVAIRPEEGIMQIETLEGTWRGVFPHKNVLGPVMAVGVFTELFVLVATQGRQRWRFVLLAIFLALVVLSRSVTALLMSVAFIVAACLYLLWKRDPVLARAASIFVVLASLLAAAIFWANPELALGFLGKDTGLTGRIELWELVRDLISDRPILGYGYRAMWAPNDIYRILADQATGGWGVTSSHNTFLEIILELGLVGGFIILAIVLAAFWRGLKCCARGMPLLGWFSLVFFATIVLAGTTIETLGWNQNIFWLVFTILFLSCGMRLFRDTTSRELHSSARSFSEASSATTVSDER